MNSLLAVAGSHTLASPVGSSHPQCFQLLAVPGKPSPPVNEPNNLSATPITARLWSPFRPNLWSTFPNGAVAQSNLQTICLHWWPAPFCHTAIFGRPDLTMFRHLVSLLSPAAVGSFIMFCLRAVLRISYASKKVAKVGLPITIDR